MEKSKLEIRLEKEAQKLEQQKAKVTRLKRQKSQQERKDLTRKKIIVGAIVLKTMDIKDEFRNHVEDLLDKHVNDPNDREFLGLAPKLETKPTVRIQASQEASAKFSTTQD